MGADAKWDFSVSIQYLSLRQIPDFFASLIFISIHYPFSLNTRLTMPLSASPILAAFERVRALRTQRIVSDDSADADRDTHGRNSTMPGTMNPNNIPCSGNIQKRSTQHVLTNTQWGSIVKWMMNAAAKDGNKHILSRAVARFSSLFRGSDNANLAKASRLWKSHIEYVDAQGKMSLKGNHSVITRRINGVRA